MTKDTGRYVDGGNVVELKGNLPLLWSPVFGSQTALAWHDERIELGQKGDD